MPDAQPPVLLQFRSGQAAPPGMGPEKDIASLFPIGSRIDETGGSDLQTYPSATVNEFPGPRPEIVPLYGRNSTEIMSDASTFPPRNKTSGKGRDPSL